MTFGGRSLGKLISGNYCLADRPFDRLCAATEALADPNTWSWFGERLAQLQTTPLEEPSDGDPNAATEYRKQERAVLMRIEEALASFVLTLHVRLNEVRVEIREVNCAAAGEGISGFERMARAPLPPEVQRVWHLANFIKHWVEWDEGETSKPAARILCDLGAARVHYDAYGESLLVHDWPVLIGVCALANESLENPSFARAIHTVVGMCSDWANGVIADIQSRASCAVTRIEEIRKERQQQSRIRVSDGKEDG